MLGSVSLLVILLTDKRHNLLLRSRQGILSSNILAWCDVHEVLLSINKCQILSLGINNMKLLYEMRLVELDSARCVKDHVSCIWLRLCASCLRVNKMISYVCC